MSRERSPELAEGLLFIFLCKCKVYRMKPLIGVPCSTLLEEREKEVKHFELAFADTRAIDLAGGVPVGIPLGLSEEALRDAFQHIDGLLSTGGADVHPRHYGAELDPSCGPTDPVRDKTELYLMRLALQNIKPILAVCRGIQLLNVAQGGTLYQDISTKLRTSINHDQPDERAKDYIHNIQVEPGSRLEKILGTSSLRVNSLHHQAIERLAEGFHAVARADDDVVEAIEPDDGRFIVGVQFHPEHLVEQDERMLNLFKVFVTECARSKMRDQELASARF